MKTNSGGKWQDGPAVPPPANDGRGSAAAPLICWRHDPHRHHGLPAQARATEAHQGGAAGGGGRHAGEGQGGRGAMTGAGRVARDPKSTCTTLSALCVTTRGRSNGRDGRHMAADVLIWCSINDKFGIAASVMPSAMICSRNRSPTWASSWSLMRASAATFIFTEGSL